VIFTFTIISYLKRYMGAPTGVDVEALKAENESLKAEVADLKGTVEQLNTQV
jgi:hypothetical protein